MDQPYAIRREPHLMRVQVTMASIDSAANDFVSLHAPISEDMYSIVKRSEEPQLDLGRPLLLAFPRCGFAHRELDQPSVVQRLPRVQREVPLVGRKCRDMRRQSVPYGL